MLQMRNTRIIVDLLSPVAPGVLVPEEGLALVWSKVNGESVVSPSAGAGIFAGVSKERFAPPARVPFIGSFTIESGAVELPRAPVAIGQIGVLGLGASIVAPTVGTEAGAAGTAVLDGTTLLFDEADEGKTITVQLLYVPTVEEARSFQGDLPFGGHASALTQTIGRIVQGEIATSAFDPSKDWTNVLAVGLGPNGTFIPAAGANTVPNVVVLNSPSAANPFLILQLLAA